VSRRWRIRLVLPAVLFVAAVILLAISHPGDVPFGLGWGLVGVLGVVLVAYLLLAVGESEDRDRRATQRRRNGRNGGPHR
jgi:peptidoglycan/LPS O-acetylase OafA/YrhL